MQNYIEKEGLLTDEWFQCSCLSVT